jgi:dsDNA-specific endonuclease/ATPase MutS2
LSDKGKQEGKLMEEVNKKASDAVFHEKNNGNDDHTVDLHGLYVEEAVNRARQAIQQAKREVVSVCLNALNSTVILPLQIQAAPAAS